MKTSSKNPRTVDTDHAVKNDGKPRLPNERDTTPDIQSLEPTKKMKQAHDDIEHGLVDRPAWRARAGSRQKRHLVAAWREEAERYALITCGKPDFVSITISPSR